MPTFTLIRSNKLNCYFFLYILLFKILDSRHEDEIFWFEWQQALFEFEYALHFCICDFDLLFVYKYLNFVKFLVDLLPTLMLWFYLPLKCDTWTCNPLPLRLILDKSPY
jgi:hypothetical protein